MTKIFLATLLLLTFPEAFADPDEAIFHLKLKAAYSKTQFPARTLAVAQSLLGTPYEHSTLDQRGDTEMLVVNLRQLDCWTFVENAVAMAQTAAANRGDFDFYKEKLQELRYWGGTVDGFGSRIHYFTGWILQQEKRGLLTDITKTLDGKPYRKAVNYITAHPNYFPQLTLGNNLQNLLAAEKRLAEHAWFFIPKAKVAGIESKLKDGDLVATTSSRGDLDISHQGFAVRKNGRVHLLHASSDGKKVIVSSKPLSEYLARNKGQSGIIVCRFADSAN